MTKCIKELNRLAKAITALKRREREQGYLSQEDGGFAWDYDSPEFKKDAMADEYKEAVKEYKKCIGPKPEPNDQMVNERGRKRGPQEER